MKVTWILPIKTVSEMNCNEHYQTKSKRHRQQQFFVRSLFKHEAAKIEFPCSVKLIRLGPRFLDSDNLPTSMKYIQDEIAAQLFPEKVIYYKRKGKMYSNKGQCDNDPRVTWSYHQEKYPTQAVRIEICFDDHFVDVNERNC